MRKTEESNAFSEVEHRHDNPVASLEYAHVNKSVAMRERKAPISMFSRSKECNKLRGFKHMKITSGFLVTIVRDGAETLLIQVPPQSLRICKVYNFLIKLSLYTFRFFMLQLFAIFYFSFRRVGLVSNTYFFQFEKVNSKDCSLFTWSPDGCSR